MMDHMGNCVKVCHVGGVEDANDAVEDVAGMLAGYGVFFFP